LSARARIVLSSATGEANSSISERLELTKATVGKWRARFIERRCRALRRCATRAAAHHRR
jgi:putative transposase